MATLDYVESWSDRLLTRLFTQFRSATSWRQWCEEVLGPQFQDLEDAAQTLFTLLDIDASEGAQLDVIGRIVGQPRRGLLDVTYRLYLRARILASKSKAATDNIFAVMRALYGQTEARPLYSGGWIKQFAVQIRKVLTRDEALAGVEFLGIAKDAGARGILEWQESDDSEMFEFMSDGSPASTTTAAGLIAGVSSVMLVSDASAFPSAGWVHLAGSNEEAVEYTSKTGSQLNLATQVFYSHLVGDTVTQVLGDGLGLDHGDFAAAAQA